MLDGWGIVARRISGFSSGKAEKRNLDRERKRGLREYHGTAAGICKIGGEALELSPADAVRAVYAGVAHEIRER